MAHNTLVDLVKCSVTSDGAGALVLGAAVPSFRGAERLIDGAQYGYSIQQGSNYEFGEGVFTQALGTLTRSVLDSSNGGLAITLDPNAVVSFVVLAKDLTLAADIVDEIRALTQAAEDAAAAAATSEENSANSAATSQGWAGNSAASAGAAATSAGEALARQRLAQISVPFPLRADLLGAPGPVDGVRAQVFYDLGTHAAIAGEIAFDGTPAVVGAAIPNLGEYQYTAPNWLRIGNLNSQIVSNLADSFVRELGVQVIDKDGILPGVYRADYYVPYNMTATEFYGAVEDGTGSCVVSMFFNDTLVYGPATLTTTPTSVTGLNISAPKGTKVSVLVASVTGSVVGIEPKLIGRPDLFGAGGGSGDTTGFITAGTNAQGQGALTFNVNIINVAAANPSGATLPTGSTGKIVRVVNTTANPVNIYPPTGGTIDSLAANASLQLKAGGTLQFISGSATQWYSNLNTASEQLFIYTTPGAGTWTPPAGMRSFEVICIGAGAGGGSGARQATSAARFGGGGGGGGAISFARFSGAPASVSYTVGTGGTGGASVGTDTTNGAAGTSGGLSFAAISTTNICRASGGTFGSGGTTTAGQAGNGGTAMIAGGTGGAGASTTGSSGATANSTGGGGGGAGAAAASTTTANGGGTGFFNATAGGTNGGNGADATVVTTLGGATAIVMGGNGGGGGSYKTGQATGAGGAGAAPGGGGGGGAASDNGFASGAGGAGGAGGVIFIAKF